MFNKERYAIDLLHKQLMKKPESFPELNVAMPYMMGNEPIVNTTLLDIYISPEKSTYAVISFDSVKQLILDHCVASLRHANGLIEDIIDLQGVIFTLYQRESDHGTVLFPSQYLLVNKKEIKSLVNDLLHETDYTENINIDINKIYYPDHTLKKLILDFG
jgi:hypothetical protein